MAKDIRIQTRLRLSKQFEPGVGSFSLGKYRVSALPSDQPGVGEAILEFPDTFEAPIGGGSHPEEEATIVCNLLSLDLDARVSHTALRLNDIDIPSSGRPALYSRYTGVFSAVNADRHLRHFNSLPIDLARQVSRACRAFASALHFIPSDPTFAFFLLVVAVECLSSQAAIIPADDLDLDSKKCERFCRFIEQFLPASDRGDDERNAELLKELLKTAYYSHRSSFVHGGREVSSAALMADAAGSSYFKHATDGREVRTPGLGWFAGIARGSILGYLLSQENAQVVAQDDLPATLAFEKAALRLKAKKNMEAGHAVTLGDIDYR